MNPLFEAIKLSRYYFEIYTAGKNHSSGASVELGRR
jgi:hypothetical protein